MQSGSQITLHHYWRSSCSWRVRWALEYKGIDYVAIPVNLLKSDQKNPEYLSINPAGNVPVLTVDGQIITESQAIIEWLEDSFPQNPLRPDDNWQKARVRELACMVSTGIQPMQNLRVAHYFSADAAQREEWIRHFIRSGLGPVELWLNQHAGHFSLGDKLTYADLFLIPQVYNALRYKIDMAAFPKAHSIYTRCLALPSCYKTSPEQQEGAIT